MAEIEEINEKLDKIIDLLSKSEDKEQLRRQMIDDYNRAVEYRQYVIASRIGREYRNEFGSQIVKEY